MGTFVIYGFLSIVLQVLFAAAVFEGRIEESRKLHIFNGLWTLVNILLVLAAIITWPIMILYG